MWHVACVFFFNHGQIKGRTMPQGKVVTSPNESARRDSNMYFHPYAVIIDLSAEPTTHWLWHVVC